MKCFRSGTLLRKRSVSRSWNRNLFFIAAREGFPKRQPEDYLTIRNSDDEGFRNSFPGRILRVCLITRGSDGKERDLCRKAGVLEKNGMNVVCCQPASALYCRLCLLTEDVGNEKFYEVALIMDGIAKAVDTLIISSEDLIFADTF